LRAFTYEINEISSFGLAGFSESEFDRELQYVKIIFSESGLKHNTWFPNHFELTKPPSNKT
jgi:hypothetical protein